MNLDEQFRDTVQSHAQQINSYICDIIDLCPSCEGVQCQQCIEYALEILLEGVKRND
jgi:hypothetical protein